MAGWFSRSSREGERAGSEPVEFAVLCGCGSTVLGTRNRRMQVVLCRKCATQLCILPVSPYPRPKLREPKKKPIKPSLKPLRELTSDDIEIVTPTPVSRRSSSKPLSTSDNRPAKPISKPVFPFKSKAASKAAQKPDEAPLDEFLPLIPRRKIFTPLRLISVGMVCVIFLGGWWTLHRRAVHQAGLTFAETARSGRAALAKSDFEAADQYFRRAVKALDLLGREDREARQIRQLARETSVAVGLASTSLFELVSESRQAKTMSGDGWQQPLKRSYQGSWFLFDASGLKFDDTEAKRKWTFSMPLVAGEEPIVVRGDLSYWSKILGDNPPTQLIFAAQLEDIVPNEPSGNGWDFVLNGKTLVLWADEQQFVELGGYADETTRATLKSQAQLLGILE